MKKLWLTLFLALALKAGNNTNQPTITHFEIRALMQKTGIPTGYLHLADKQYTIPKINWVTNDVFNVYKAFLKTSKLEEYKEESNDCDKFVRLFCTLAANEHFKNNVNSAVAIGEAWYVIEADGSAHALNIILVKNDEEPIDIVFFDPQKNLKLNLTKAEKQSFFFIRF